ncbi:MAG: glutaredoxin domain-containing protein [Candidatus Anstonellaceae archaeon]
MQDPELERIKALKMQQLKSQVQRNLEQNRKIKVQVYSTPTCPYCYMLKQYLRSKNIEFEDIDVSRDIEAARYMISQTGQMGVPQVNISGQWIVGFDRVKIDQLLGLDD